MKTLDEPATGGSPAVHFAAIGDSVTVGLVNVTEYQQKDFDTGDLEYWNDDPTQPKMGKVVTGLVVGGSGANVTIDEQERPAVPGDLVTFWCEGGKHFTWRDAVKAAKGVQIGNVMQWTWAGEKPPKKKGFNAQKVYEAVIRQPAAKDGDLPERCQAAFEDAQNRPTLEAAPVDPVYDEEPF